MSNTSDKYQNGQQSSNEQKVFLSTIVLVFVAISVVGFYGFKAGDFFSVTATGVIIEGAFALLGVLLGFLFGIPRTVSGDNFENADHKIRYQVNTNLEQISDWLTKILVGVGLTEFKTIGETLEHIVFKLQTSFPSIEGIERFGFVVGIIIYSVIAGFLCGYLWTRIIITPMFYVADERLSERENKVKYLERQLGFLSEIKSVNDKVLSSLYDYEQQGFLKSIQYCQEFQDKWKDIEINDVFFWIRFACAYAQKYKWDLNEDNKDHLNDTKAMCFSAIDKAIKTDKDVAKFWLNYFGNKNPIGGKSPDEDDFEIFWDDSEFQRRIKS